MKKLISAAATAGCLLAVTGCMSVPPANVGTTYQCDRGTTLQVSYLRNGALVRVNGARGIPFTQTPSNTGDVYENGAKRLARNGNMVSWNTADRSAPETCRVVNTIN